MPLYARFQELMIADAGTPFKVLRKGVLRHGRATSVDFNDSLMALAPAIAAKAGLKVVRLIDVHSFCWAFSELLKRQNDGTIGKHLDPVTYGDMQKKVVRICMSVENTVKNSNGQIVQRTVKDKQLKMTRLELERLVTTLFKHQNCRCELTGIPFDMSGQGNDHRPSLDRIDSNRHYEHENLQLVCKFINFWKGDSDNERFKTLLGWSAACNRNKLLSVVTFFLH